MSGVIQRPKRSQHTAGGAGAIVAPGWEETAWRAEKLIRTGRENVVVLPNGSAKDLAITRLSGARVFALGLATGGDENLGKSNRWRNQNALDWV